MLNLNHLGALWSEKIAAKRASRSNRFNANAPIYQGGNIPTSSMTAKSFTLAPNSPLVRNGDILLVVAPDSGLVSLPPVGVFGTTADSIAGIVANGYYPTLNSKQSVELYKMEDFVTRTMQVDPAVQDTVVAAITANEEAYKNKVVTFVQLATPTAQGRNQVIDPTVSSSGSNYARIHSMSVNRDMAGNVTEVLAEITFIA